MKKFDAKPVKEVDYEKQLKRLERKQKIIDKVSMGMFGSGVVIEGLSQLSFFCLPVMHKTQAMLEIGGVFAGAALMGAGWAGQLRSNSLKDKIDKLKRKNDPDKYYQDLIKREQQTLAHYAELVANSQAYSAEEVGEAVKSLPKQKEKTEIFAEAYKLGKDNGKIGRVQHLMNLYEDRPADRDRSVALMKRFVSENSVRK